MLYIFLLLICTSQAAPIRGKRPKIKQIITDSIKPISIRIDRQSPAVALAITEAMKNINQERTENSKAQVRVINIVSARRSAILVNGKKQYTIKVQLRKDGGRLEFQKLVVNELQPLQPQTVSPISEAILTDKDMLPVGRCTYHLVSHEVVRSSLSAPRHRASMVLVPAGKVVPAGDIIQSLNAQTTPLATPP
tara:strand:+ start:2105 stop:2683 length:579 start_codon:yes stop_codon:yes gene_type:complete